MASRVIGVKRSRLRKSCGRPGQLSPRVNITHYVTPPQSGKPCKWPPDTCGMVFEKLILKPADVGKKHLNHRQAVETRGQPLIFHYSSAPPAISRERSP